MSTSYTEVFTGKNIGAAFPQYSQFDLSSNIEMAWPNQFQNTLSVVSVFMDINPTAQAPGPVNFKITMPDARQMGTGFIFTINNYGAFGLDLMDNTGTLIYSIPSATARIIVLTDNKTVTSAGLWRTLPGSAGGSSVTSIDATVLGGINPPRNLVITGAPALPITGVGTINFALGADLLSLTSFAAATGITVRTAPDTWALRSLAGTAGQVNIANSNGVAGSPTFSLDPNITGLTSLAVGNLSLSANTIASTNGNGAIILAPQGTGKIQLSGDAELASTKKLKFFADNGANYVTFRAGASVITQDFIWPTAAPVATQVLGFAGGSSLSWVSVPTTATTSTVDALARFSNTVGGLKDSIGVTLSDARALATLASCAIGSFLIGSVTPGVGEQTITTTGANLNIILQPDGIGWTQVKGDLSVESSAGSQRKLRLYNQAGTFFAGLKASASLMVTDAIWALPAVGSTAGYFVTDSANAMTIRPFPTTVVDIVPKFSDITGSLTSSALSISGTGAATGLTSLAVSGALTSATLTATGAISGASVAATAAVTGATVTATGALSGASATIGNITVSAVANTIATVSNNNLILAPNGTGFVNLSNSTVSTSTSTGALTTAGGIGVALKAFIGGTLNVTDTTDSSSTSTGSGIFSGGVGLAKALTAGGIIKTTDATDSTSSVTGSLQCAGGLGVAKRLNVGTQLAIGVNRAVASAALEVVGAGGISISDGLATASQKQLSISYNTVSDRSEFVSIHQGISQTDMFFSAANYLFNGTNLNTTTASFAITTPILGLNSTVAGGGSGVICMLNAAVVPAGATTNTGVLYVQAGALKYKGSSGTITTIAPA